MFRSIAPVFVLVLCVIGLMGICLVERRRSQQLRFEMDEMIRLSEPDFFVKYYHPDLERSALAVDPLASTTPETRKLIVSLLNQRDAWRTGLMTYLGVDRIRETFDPTKTMSVWWQGKLTDQAGDQYFVYLADRERDNMSANQLRGVHGLSAVIVTDAENKLITWHGTGVDGTKVTSIRLVGNRFPATIEYVEQSRHNGDAGHFSRILAKTGLQGDRQ